MVGLCGAAIGSTRPRPRNNSRPVARSGASSGVASAGSAGAAEAMQERGDGGGRVDLDHPVEITDGDARFQCRGGDDYAVPGFGESEFGPAPSDTGGTPGATTRPGRLHLA